MTVVTKAIVLLQLITTTDYNWTNHNKIDVFRAEGCVIVALPKSVPSQLTFVLVKTYEDVFKT